MDDISLLEKKAVSTSLAGDWEKAIDLNKEILAIDSVNIGALNRLALAYWETENAEKARKSYQQVLELDRYNPIALKNLQRLNDQEKRTNHHPRPLAHVFLEEPGKTKVLSLLRLAAPKVLAVLNCADRVLLCPKKRIIDINNEDGTYLGCLPEDVSQRLISLIEGGNRYDAYVKGVDRHSLEVFIIETFRSRKFKNLPSFSSLPYSYLSDFDDNLMPEEN